jgi:HEPN domain-containing protein
LILLPPESPKSRYQQYQELIGAATADIGSVMCAFDSSTRVYQLLLEGHIFYSRICKKEKLLYDNHQVVLPQRTKRLGKEIINNAGAVFNRRYERACDFMAGASYFQKKGNPHMAAFHLSQAAILILMGFLSALTGTRHFTNNLSGLMRLMLRFTIDVYVPFPLYKPEDVRLLQLLDSAYIGVRYRDNFRVTTEESAMLFNRVAQLQRIVEEEMNDRLNYLIYWL